MKREFNKKKILLLTLLASLFLIPLIIQFVAAAMTPEEIILDPIKSMFTNWASGQLSVNLAKYLFLALMAILVWSVLDMIGFMDNEAVKWIASIIIAFLSVSYLTPNDIWILLTSYEALGLTLLFTLPLIILGLFTFRIVAVGKATGIVVQWGMWVIYFLFLIYEYVQGLTTGRIDTTQASSWLFIIILIVVFIMIFFNRLIVKWLGEEFVNAEVTTAENVVEKAAKMTRIRASELDVISGSSKRIKSK